jgi:hypothetical protein
MTLRGTPISSTCRRPMHRAAEGVEKPALAATNVQVSAARIVCRAGWPVSQSSPLGKSTASFGGGGGVEVIDHGIQRWAWFALRAGAQQGVDDPRGVPQQFREPCRIVCGAEDLNRNVGFCEDTEIGRGVAGEFLRLGPEQHADRMAAQVEMACDHEAVARIIPLATAYGHRAGDAQPAEHVGHASAGVLHQHQPAETELPDGQLINQPGLLAGENQGTHQGKPFPGSGIATPRTFLELLAPGYPDSTFLRLDSRQSMRSDGDAQ